MPATADFRLTLLDDIRVASPCPMQWSDMDGDERRRFCGSCKQNVYNFAEMTRQEIVDLLDSGSGRVCGRLYRRHDGTILTRDCPVGLAAAKQQAARVARRVAATLAVVCSFGFVSHAATSKGEGRLRSLQPFAWISAKLAPATAVPPGPFLAGEIALPPNWNGQGQGTCGTALNGEGDHS